MSAVADLRRITAFADLGEAELAWLAERAAFEDVESGRIILLEGQAADEMIGVIEGEIRARREKGPPDGRLFVFSAGELTGMLPFSRMTTYPVTGRAVGRTRIVRFPVSIFGEMFRRIPVLEPRLVQILADRVRRITRDDEQREMLDALGKLAAGLAHELDNPATAAKRAAATLADRLQALGPATLALSAHDIDADALRALLSLRPDEDRVQDPSEDALARTEREEALGEWLEDRGVDRCWDLAGYFVDAGVDVAALEPLAASLPERALPDALAWLEAVLTAQRMGREIAHASGRISDLVAAVKSYSQLDRAPEKAETDVHVGLESTLAMLGHKMGAKAIRVVREYAPDLPAVPAYPGELNQVWTNLLDNAMDAVADAGVITIRTAREPRHVLVEIADDGPGIPPEVRPRIWEPFFTTKDVGRGTGLGLDIVHRIVVRRHAGEVGVVSVPGDTRFQVRLPLAGD